MDALLTLLTEFVKRGFGPGKPEAPRKIRVDLDGAPASVAALARAMAENNYKVSLGAFLMRDQQSVCTLDAEIEAARGGDFEDFDATLQTASANGGPFDVTKTLLLCHDRGGMSALGVTWCDGEPGCVVVELEEPFEDNFLTHLKTPEAFIARLAEINEDAGHDAPDLDAIRERIG